MVLTGKPDCSDVLEIFIILLDLPVTGRPSVKGSKEQGYENDCYNTEFVNQLALPSYVAHCGQEYLVVFIWMLYWRFWDDSIFPVYWHSLANYGHYDLGNHQWTYYVYRA